MALITTTGSLIRLYNPFTGLSATERSQSGIARAEIVYYNVNDTWAAAGSGNTREYTSGFVELPKDFGYVLTDAYIRVSADSGGLVCEATSHMRLYPGGVLGPQINLSLSSDAGRANDSTSTAIGSLTSTAYNTIIPSFGKSAINYSLKDKSTALLYPFEANTYTSSPNPASEFQFQVGENVAGFSSAYNVSCFLRFLQYDVDQSYNYVIQSPQLTR